MNTKLTTVPTFTFYQGDPGDQNYERPIRVEYFDGTISLLQKGEYDIEEEIMMNTSNVKELFKEILKHLPRAIALLEQRSATKP